MSLFYRIAFNKNYFLEHQHKFIIRQVHKYKFDPFYSILGDILDSGGQVGVIFTDMLKAFNKIDFHILLVV